jgi:hypothetical protein
VVSTLLYVLAGLMIGIVLGAVLGVRIFVRTLDRDDQRRVMGLAARSAARSDMAQEAARLGHPELAKRMRKLADEDEVELGLLVTRGSDD